MSWISCVMSLFISRPGIKAVSAVPSVEKAWSLPLWLTRMEKSTAKVTHTRVHTYNGFNDIQDRLTVWKHMFL